MTAQDVDMIEVLRTLLRVRASRDLLEMPEPGSPKVSQLPVVYVERESVRLPLSVIL